MAIILVKELADTHLAAREGESGQKQQQVNIMIMIILEV